MCVNWRSFEISLVGTQVYRSDVVKVEGRSWKGESKRFRQIALSKTLEFAIVTLRTLQVEP